MHNYCRELEVFGVFGGFLREAELNSGQCPSQPGSGIKIPREVFSLGVILQEVMDGLIKLKRLLNSLHVS